VTKEKRLPVATARESPGPSRVVPETTPAAALIALGIVYGDLGTSPLYKLQTVLQTAGVKFTPQALRRQAMQLGWFPGLRIRQTSADQYGQIYVPFVNWMMVLFTMALTIGFGNSVRLAVS
jgi:K+ transporter